MIRVLHLLDRDADFQTRRAVQSLHAAPGEEFDADVRTIGRGGDGGTALAAVFSLKRERSPADVVHAWGTRALVAAALGFNGPLAFSPAPEGRPPMRWLRAAMAYRDVQVFCPTATLRKTMVGRGVPIERCHLVRPGVEFSRVRRRRDADLRRALGFGNDDFVLLAAGESTRSAGHPYAVWSTAMLARLDARYKLLLWGRGEKAGRVMQFARRVRETGLVCEAEARLGRELEFEELLPAADAVLVTASGPVATLPVSIAMAAGLPIVATVSYTIGELLEDRHNALMVAEASPRLIARRVLDLREDSGLQWSISDTARAEAYEHFSHSRFLHQYRAAYRQMAERQKVEVPEQGPGAALRFASRG